MKLAPCRRFFARFARGNSKAAGGYEASLAQLLEDAVQVMRERQDRLFAASHGCMLPSTDEPLIVVMVDELDRAPPPGSTTGPIQEAHRTPPSGSCSPKAGRSVSSVSRGDPGPPQGRPAATGPVSHPHRAPAERGRAHQPHPRPGRPTARCGVRHDPRHPARRRLGPVSTASSRSSLRCGPRRAVRSVADYPLLPREITSGVARLLEAATLTTDPSTVC